MNRVRQPSPSRRFSQLRSDGTQGGEDPSQASLEDKDKRLLLFVLKSIQTPEAVTQDDVDALRDLGWSDTDIFDAVAHGTNMIGASIMMKAFKID